MRNTHCRGHHLIHTCRGRCKAIGLPEDTIGMSALRLRESYNRDFTKSKVLPLLSSSNGDAFGSEKRSVRTDSRSGMQEVLARKLDVHSLKSGRSISINDSFRPYHVSRTHPLPSLFGGIQRLCALKGVLEEATTLKILLFSLTGCTIDRKNSEDFGKYAGFEGMAKAAIASF